MHQNSFPTSAEFADRIVQTTALALFMVAIMFVLAVVEFFVAPALARTLDWIAMGLGASTVLLVAAIYFRQFRQLDGDERRRCVGEDGFLPTLFRAAMARSFTMVFVVLALLQALDQLVLSRFPEMPIEVVLQAVLALMLLTFSVVFGLSVWGEGESEPDDEFDEPHNELRR